MGYFLSQTSNLSFPHIEGDTSSVLAEEFFPLTFIEGNEKLEGLFFVVENKMVVCLLT